MDGDALKIFQEQTAPTTVNQISISFSVVKYYWEIILNYAVKVRQNVLLIRKICELSFFQLKSTGMRKHGII